MTGRIDILGAGAFGTALALTYARAGHAVTLWARDGAEAMEAARENARRLPGHRFPDSLRVTGDLGALTADLALLALPTQSLGPFLSSARLRAGTLVSCAKGIDRDTGLGPTALIARHSGATPAQLTGPSFAVDIAAGLPTALTLACADDRIGAAVQDRLSTHHLRLYRTTDVIGAEMGGALKNVVAIAAGAVIGAGYGDSARAALIARGFAEMARVARAAGAQEATLTGLSGLGDLVLTCGSEKSRNFRFGMALARGETLGPGVTVEGLHTAHEIAARGDLDTPLADAVAALADGRADVATIADALLNRPLKPE
ncbi:NAD(P)H-dependent glycerol-3-phosphate dehydrogenase [Roseicyclus persicicus]|uniref:Glycerol-3-phosphate dehydrogenase [NAD(P)+] n=1 Tax=Roseicyclus persicicus TaxID=2650661 RepID=A0A7X6GZL2_9RHOB|nr:NAD(P)H-dependent glycerol-3-phosphate dehydrogenase [Roseibacterium persicicum]NKX45309.1 NAD(P)H-dependent glycerol-3-phosphate dehydrogenase [Roseibacterium persicicum]